ncbi:alpha/beta family hydrolase [Marinomonas atlantica]|uniref:alpha/beta family hydrolase n=1 Tax=Marinomonas atlantica TaxID=1806668 RepID=UPI000AA66870|nr:alpha/beta family hydrolase [Marinomonas atlantica]
MEIPCHRATFLTNMIKVYLLHGAGAGHQSDFLQSFKQRFEDEVGLQVNPVTLDYMVQIETTGKMRPPPRIPKLVEEVQQKIDPETPIVLIGKSMGCRIIAELCASHNVQACIALGFPFYPAKKTDKHRLAHFEQTGGVPYYILQGTRDSLGNHEWVTEQNLPENVHVKWIEGADHDFRVLKRYNMSDLEVVQKLAAHCAVILHDIDIIR